MDLAGTPSRKALKFIATESRHDTACAFHCHVVDATRAIPVSYHRRFAVARSNAVQNAPECDCGRDEAAMWARRVLAGADR